jgi:hypothetical protein
MDRQSANRASSYWKEARGMSPVHIDELNPETPALKQIGETEGSTALATVEKQSFMTVEDHMRFASILDGMTNDQLADTVIEGVKKIQHYLPYIHTLKDRFERGKRDSRNQLITPIKDCYSWKEFCKKHLDHTPQAIGKALAPKPNPKQDVVDPFNAVWKQVNVLRSYSGDGNEHKFVLNMASLLQADLSANQQEAQLILSALREIIANFTVYADQLEDRIRVAGVA